MIDYTHPERPLSAAERRLRNGLLLASGLLSAMTIFGVWRLL